MGQGVTHIFSSKSLVSGESLRSSPFTLPDPVPKHTGHTSFPRPATRTQHIRQPTALIAGALSVEAGEAVHYWRRCALETRERTLNGAQWINQIKSNRFRWVVKLERITSRHAAPLPQTEPSRDPLAQVSLHLPRRAESSYRSSWGTR